MHQAKSVTALATLYLLSFGCVDTETSCEELVTCPQPPAGGTSGAAGEDSGGSAGTSSSSGTSTGGAGGFGGTTSASGGTTSSTGGTGTGTGVGGADGGTGGSAGDGGGGTTASSGGTGGSVVVPCDGACDGDTPRCDEENETCVECLENEHCDEGICDPETHQCVECLENEHCDEPTAHCDPEQQFCVECLENTDCTSPQESVCDAGSCSPCQTNDDCAHLTGTTICNVDAGQCVQCTTAEEAVCDGTSCNPATNTCTTTELGTVDDCQPCLADSDCIGYDQAEPLRRCVPMEFNGELRGQAYCLKRQAAGCERPYSVLITATSVSGAPEETYCGIGQQNVTCEAVLDLFQSRSCPGGQDDECGCPRDEDGNCTAAGVGGLCRTVGAFDNQCTYGCGAINHCPTNFTCANQDPDFCQ